MKKRHDGKQQSLRNLDWISFSMADVQMAVGAFVALYLAAGLDWNPGKVGIAVGVQNIATMAAQTPVGALIDCSGRKKWILAAGAAIVGAGCLGVLATRTLCINSSFKLLSG